MAARSFLLLGLAQIAEHKLENVLPHGRIELIFDFDGVVAALSFNSFELSSRVHFAQSKSWRLFLRREDQIRLQAVSRPCLQSQNLGGVERAVALRDCDELARRNKAVFILN